jgi:hypothetical protein
MKKKLCKFFYWLEPTLAPLRPKICLPHIVIKEKLTRDPIKFPVGCPAEQSNVVLAVPKYIYMF